MPWITGNGISLNQLWICDRMAKGRHICIMQLAQSRRAVVVLCGPENHVHVPVIENQKPQITILRAALLRRLNPFPVPTKGTTICQFHVRNRPFTSSYTFDTVLLSGVLLCYALDTTITCAFLIKLKKIIAMQTTIRMPFWAGLLIVPFHFFMNLFMNLNVILVLTQYILFNIWHVETCFFPLYIALKISRSTILN